jgi:hypothetical protein
MTISVLPQRDPKPFLEHRADLAIAEHDRLYAGKYQIVRRAMVPDVDQARLKQLEHDAQVRAGHRVAQHQAASAPRVGFGLRSAELENA